MTRDNRQLCTATTRAGVLCPRPAVPGLDVCACHRPESRALASAAQRSSVQTRARRTKQARAQAEIVQVQLLATGLDLTSAAGCQALLDHAAAGVLKGDAGAEGRAKALVQIVAASEALVRLRGYDERLAELNEKLQHLVERDRLRTPLLATVAKEAG